MTPTGKVEIYQTALDIWIWIELPQLFNFQCDGFFFPTEPMQTAAGTAGFGKLRGQTQYNEHSC